MCIRDRHLDARKLDGKPVVLFGPFALATTKFLKQGSSFDLFSSVNHNNVTSMVDVGLENLDLVKYLINQAQLTDADRHAQLLKSVSYTHLDVYKRQLLSWLTCSTPPLMAVPPV